MSAHSYRFEGFVLDPSNRRLWRGSDAIEINGRYFDALTLLVRDAGRLVSKDRFLDEVWRGVPVTDEALTQCIRTLRRQLGDDAAAPRFIETVPKHGYRFIGAVEAGAEAIPSADNQSDDNAPARSTGEFLLIGAAATIGGGMAGLTGGLIYGMAGASEPLQPGIGAVSVLLVVVCLSILIALLGAAGVGFGIAAASFAGRNRGPWSIVGGAVGGLIVGGAVKLLGLDAISLLFGRTPGDITGAPEGALLGGAVGLGAWLGSRWSEDSLRRGVLAAVIAGAIAGLIITSLGGQLMAGSLDLVARQFPGSRLRLDQIGALLGEQGFGPISRMLTGALEGALFGGCVVGAMIIARKRLRSRG